MRMTGSKKGQQVVAIIPKNEAALLDKLTWHKFQKRPIIVSATQMNVPFRIETLEGWSQGVAGDWLVEGVLGELYPCNEAVFQITYEAVE